MRKERKQTGGSGNGSSPVVKSGKARTAPVTGATVKRLERAGSSESAKIARELAQPS
jgi:hypothetical protein